jgi:SNF2 family DNA or RNA helicase
MISIDYNSDRQFCTITTDLINNEWKQIRSFYNQVSDQANVFNDSVELPWHSFISNLQALYDISEMYDLEVVFSAKANSLIAESIKSRDALASLDGIDLPDQENIENELISRGFLRPLTEEQLRNVRKLARIPFGATFSVPGAGKTTEAIAFYLLHGTVAHKLIVICPKNAFPAWEEQFILCMGQNAPNVRRLTGGTDKIQAELQLMRDCVYLISYQQYNRSSDVVAKHLQVNQSFVFIDESHRIKGGIRTETGRQVQKIAHLPVGKLIMSGTPMPLGVPDLIPQYSFLFPTDGDVNEQNVTQKIRRMYVRTTKRELGLDDPVIVRTPIPLSEPQKALYDLMRSEELRQFHNIDNSDRQFFRHLGQSYMRMLQVVSNPALLLKTSYAFPDALREAIEYGESNKIKYILIRARQLAREGKKLLIWSGFVENVESLSQKLSDLGARFIHGGVDAGSEEEENTRERIVKEFHDDPNMSVLVANPAACSEGISLHTVCHHAIYLDRNYNAAQYLQSMDRIHRLGLPPNTTTTIEIVQAPQTIDDLVDTRLLQKIRRMQEVLEDESLNVEPVTVDPDDLENSFDEDDAREFLRHLRGQL